jgi:hypothetical protein
VIHVKSNHTVVIGAGPYGLSVAAHLQAGGVPVQVLGQPLEFWKDMPQGMYLKSPWTASSLSDPRGRRSLDRYRDTLEQPPQEPIPLPYFLEYGRWFADHAVPPIDPTYVRGLTRDGDAYTLELADGRIIRAGRVVVAVGISNFAHTPDFARDLPAGFASHTQACHDLSRFKGKRVGVIGTGQSALEWAAMLHEGGADVELIVRGPVHWVSRKLYSGPAKRIFYPPTDVGPPGINWIIAFPLLLRWFPYRYRRSMHVRAVRPAGAKWLRPRVEGQLPITDNTPVRGARVRDDRLILELEDGTSRELDHLILGTGYRPHLDKIPFLHPSVRRAITSRNGLPVLNRWFESSLPGLHFVGGVAGYSFGPLCNFVAGAKVAARQVASRARRAG